MLRQEARIRLLTEAAEQRRRAFDVGEEEGQSSRGSKPKLDRQFGPSAGREFGLRSPVRLGPRSAQVAVLVIGQY
jgi:general stress protein YciG